MSAAGRFAPMTAQLLARKGEARPLNLLGQDRNSIDRRDVVLERDTTALPSRSHNPREANAMDCIASDPAAMFEAGNFFGEKASPGRRHSVSLSVSDSEFERLGLVAVKKRVNKQQLLRLAIDCYLERLVAEYRSECHCISAGDTCCGSKQGLTPAPTSAIRTSCGAGQT